jgi:hypothetical protein
VSRILDISEGGADVSYEEKGAWVYLVVVVVTFTGYVAVVGARADGGPLTEVAYVAPLLWSLGVSIVLSILGRIAVEIARPSEMLQADVRDKEITRSGDYVTGVVVGFGVLLPLGLALAEQDHFWIANAIYAVSALGAVVGTVVRLVAYRRGL